MFESEGMTPNLTFTGDALKRADFFLLSIQVALSLFTFGLLARRRGRNAQERNGFNKKIKNKNSVKGILFI